MGFHYAEADLNGLIDSGTITDIHPHPVLVDYPETFENTSLTSRDGNALVQHGDSDSRTRQWVWKGYSPDTPGYTRLIDSLLQLQSSLRENLSTPKSPWVFLKEDVTGNLNKLVLSGNTWIESVDYVRVKVLSVSEAITQSGTVKYDTTLSFKIDDDTWNRF